MFARGKYIVGLLITDGMSVIAAVCFPETGLHAAFRPMFEEIYSAGFFHLHSNLTVSVYGESTSLNIKSRQEDMMHVSRALALPDTIC